MALPPVVARANSGRLMDDSQAEMLAFRALPKGTLADDLVHQPLERINKEIKRRSRVVGISPTTPPSSAWSARSWPTCMTDGKPAPAATDPTSPWSCSTPKAIINPR